MRLDHSSGFPSGRSAQYTRSYTDCSLLSSIRALRDRAYVTPAHQHPLGYVMPAADRLALLAASRERGTVVVEDDYDSEFRYDVAPIPALTSLDRQVAYLGTASKSVGPGLRVGWMVPPPDLLRPLVALREQTYDMPSWPAQRAL